MTVKELIEKLKGLNPDMRLGILDSWDCVQELRSQDLYLIDIKPKYVIDIVGKLDD